MQRLRFQFVFVIFWLWLRIFHRNVWSVFNNRINMNQSLPHTYEKWMNRLRVATDSETRRFLFFSSRLISFSCFQSWVIWMLYFYEIFIISNDLKFLQNLCSVRPCEFRIWSIQNRPVMVNMMFSISRFSSSIISLLQEKLFRLVERVKKFKALTENLKY